MGKKNGGQKKGNIYEADRSMTYRVEDFLRVKVYGVHWQSRLKRDLSKVEEKIAKAPEMLAGSVFEDQLDELIAGYKAEAEALKKQYKDRMAEAEKFRLTRQDDELYEAYQQAYKNGNIEILEKAVIKWFEAYKWDTTGTQFLDGCLEAISGVRQARNSTIIKSAVKDSKGDYRATKFTELRNKNDVLKTLYCYIAERMIELGMLKAPWIANDVVAIYQK